MSNFDGEILINTKIQTEDAKDDLKDLQKEMKETSDEASKSADKIKKSAKDLSEPYKEAYEKIEQLRSNDETDQKTKAAQIAGVFKGLGQSNSDAMKKAWEIVKSDSKSGAKVVIDNLEDIAQEARETNEAVEKIGTGATASGGNSFGGMIAGALGGLTGVLVQEGLDILKQAGRELVEFGKEAVKLASDLQEVQNVVDVTFTTMSDEVNDFARNAINSAGMSETMAKQYVGTFGAMAKSFGFTEKEAYDLATSLTQLTGDVASFYNLDHDEANTKLKAVFTGETEALKELGVVITQTALDQFAMEKGFKKTTKGMTEQEKVALRYKFVLEQLNDASGDFIRTEDEWANQMRILQNQMDSYSASMGQGFIRLLKPGVQFLTEAVMPAVIESADSFAKFKFSEDQVEALAGSLDSLAYETGIVVPNVEGLKMMLESMDLYAGESAEEIEELTEQEKELKKATDNITESVEALKKEYDLAISSAKELLDSQIGLLTELDDSAKREEDLRKREAEMREQEAELMNKINEAESEMNQKISEAIAEGNYKRSNDLVDSYSAKVESLTKQLSELKEENREALEELRDQSRTTAQEMVDIWKNQSSALNNYAKNLQKAMDMGLDKALVQQLSDGSQESMMILNELVNGTDASVEEINRAFAEVEQAKTTVSAVMADVQKDTSNKLKELSQKTRDEWGDMADTVGQAIREMQNYIDSLMGKTVYIDVVSQTTTGTSTSNGLINNPFSYYSLEPDAVPQLATGAVIPPNAPFTAVLGDQRNGYNLEGPEDMFRGIVREENGEVVEAMGTVSDILSAILSTVQNLSIDGQSIFDIVVDRNNLATRNYGTSPLRR